MRHRSAFPKLDVKDWRFNGCRLRLHRATPVLTEVVVFVDGSAVNDRNFEDVAEARSFFREQYEELMEL